MKTVGMIFEYVAIGIISVAVLPLVIVGGVITGLGHVLIIWPVKGIMYLVDRDAYNRNFCQPDQPLETDYNDPNLL